MPSRPRARVRARVWFLVRAVACLCAAGLVIQFVSNLKSLHDHTASVDRPAALEGTGPGGIQTARVDPGSFGALEGTQEGRDLPGADTTELDSAASAGTDFGAGFAVGEEEEEKDGEEDREEEPQVVESPQGDDSGESEVVEARPKRKSRTLGQLLEVMEDEASFSRSEFGYASDLIVVTQENMERLRARLSRPERSLPQTSPFSEKYGSCALVGNAGIARAAPHFTVFEVSASSVWQIKLE